MKSLLDAVAGQTVALVGNASSILARDDGAAIDSHQVVIRMNMGVNNVFPAEAVGRNTTVWACAKHWLKCCPPDARHVLFMKPEGMSPLGEQHWRSLDLELGVSRKLARWTPELEEACKRFVGADPGTGIRLLWWLKLHAQPAQVSVYGMDCWQTKTHWSGRSHTPNHDPTKERAAMVRLMNE